MLSCKDREALRLPTPSADLQSSRFDELADRISDKCRKWDMKVIESRFGLVPADSIRGSPERGIFQEAADQHGHEDRDENRIRNQQEGSVGKQDDLLRK